MKIAIVGFGLIGSSLARALRRSGPAMIQAIDPSPDVRTRALSLGLADETAADITALWPDAAFIALAAPVAAILAGLVDVIDAAGPQSIVFDMGSVKGPIAAHAASARPTFGRFVPAHPMAGGHRAGPDAGEADLFDGRRVILTPGPATTSAATAKVKALFERCGASVHQMTPERHDAIMAYASHGPHLLAYAQMLAGEALAPNLGEDHADFAGTGFASFTRIAASAPAVWVDILLQNRDNIEIALDGVLREVESLRRAMRAQDATDLHTRLSKAQRLRQSMENEG